MKDYSHRKNEAIKIIGVALDFYEALIVEDISFSGTDKLSYEEDVNLHAARHEFTKFVNNSDTIEEAITKVREEIAKLKRNTAKNVKLGPVVLKE